MADAPKVQTVRQQLAEAAKRAALVRTAAQAAAAKLYQQQQGPQQGPQQGGKT